MSNRNDAHTQSGSVLEFPESKSIQMQASEWLAVLDAEQPSEADLAAFKSWVNESGAHRQAFENIVEFWDELNILTEAVLPRELAEQQALLNKPHWLAQIRTQWAAVTAATTLLIVTLALQLMAPTIYTTDIGEQVTIRLADNSTVQLNTNSRLEVDYSASSRRLLLTQGEAHFSVAHNPDRPFEVYAANGRVTAIGTAFNVHLRNHDVQIIVTEGTVAVDEISEIEDLGSSPLIVQPVFQADAGTLLTYDKKRVGDITHRVVNKTDKQLSWREGVLIFHAEPLQAVVDEVSRYTDLKILIPEHHARELKVGGLFNVGDTESLFEALRDGFDIHVERVSNDVVYLISNQSR